MFKGHNVVTDEEVGDFVKGLQDDVAKEYKEEQLDLFGEDNELAHDSRKSESWPKDKNKLSRVRK